LTSQKKRKNGGGPPVFPAWERPSTGKEKGKKKKKKKPPNPLGKNAPSFKLAGGREEKKKKEGKNDRLGP